MCVILWLVASMYFVGIRACNVSFSKQSGSFVAFKVDHRMRMALEEKIRDNRLSRWMRIDRSERFDSKIRIRY